MLLSLAFVLLALSGAVLAGDAPMGGNAAQATLAPSILHLFGTDSAGRDVFLRVLAGAAQELAVALPATLLALVGGIVLGGVAGWCGGKVDDVVSRLLGCIAAFPLFVLPLGIAAAAGPGKGMMILAVAVAQLPVQAGVVRAMLGQGRRAGFLEAAQQAGHGLPGVLRQHVMPAVLQRLLAAAPARLAFAILCCATLGFCGVGLPVGTPEWGRMLADAWWAPHLEGWWSMAFPALALAITLGGLHMLASGLEISLLGNPALGNLGAGGATKTRRYS